MITQAIKEKFPGPIKGPDWLPRGALGFALYSIALLAAILSLPDTALQPGSREFFFTIGALATWRYSWGLLHFVRSLIYRKWVFRKLRAEVSAREKELMPSHAYFLITSFRIEAPTAIKVFRAAIEEAIHCGIPVTIVASLVELADDFLIRELFRQYAPPERVTLKIVRIAGSGKRDGLAAGFRCISRDMPPPDAIVAVIDGDSILERGLVRKCVPFFRLMPKLGALTTDEVCDVEGNRLIREWHDLRFAQRQLYMSSISLSRKVLTLTGRMSMFRADIVTNPEFIRKVENDSVRHWRLGRFKFLTGDDKSTWHWVLAGGYDMLYIPDVRIKTIEHPPFNNFFKSSTKLMFRWFGNMLRTNGRALALGPEKTGYFTWWCIIDQRITMWTSLTGPIFTLMLAMKYSLAFIPVYLVWIGFTRWIMAMLLLTSRPVLSWYYPFLLYYNQIWGSCIKTYVFFRLDRQSWTRQKTKLQRHLSQWQSQWINGTSTLLHVTTILCFVCAIGMFTGFLSMPVMAFPFSP